jgi:hypothetical protein
MLDAQTVGILIICRTHMVEKIPVLKIVAGCTPAEYLWGGEVSCKGKQGVATFVVRAWESSLVLLVRLRLSRGQLVGYAFHARGRDR